MKQIIWSGVILLICVVILVGSIVQAEATNHNFWWQVIGMAIVTYGVGRYHMTQIKAFKKTNNK
ncbi:hypothetical protein PT281_04450 [Lactobacillus sp. ESL0701]|uniref:hypothetical protein n=1 Tax=unclassified Lactobacillus TaxID=2620435 RepID=UPI0023F998AA|nr:MULTISPECIES: hypothetical protein [unclassified Lactobacillus]MDF7672513.1 hypothetical protein [Lactobacillus sp. ESL0701]WEV38040.1 hypothetical protein OZX58_04645 [Lactobacillus sp. ESL0680]